MSKRIEKVTSPREHAFQFNLTPTPGVIDGLRIQFRFAKPGAPARKPTIAISEKRITDPQHRSLVDLIANVTNQCLQLNFDDGLTDSDAEYAHTLNDFRAMASWLYWNRGQRQAFGMFRAAWEELCQADAVKRLSPVNQDRWTTVMRQHLMIAINTPPPLKPPVQRTKHPR